MKRVERYGEKGLVKSGVEREREISDWMLDHELISNWSEGHGVNSGVDKWWVCEWGADPQEMKIQIKTTQYDHSEFGCGGPIVGSPEEAESIGFDYYTDRGNPAWFMFHCDDDRAPEFFAHGGYSRGFKNLRVIKTIPVSYLRSFYNRGELDFKFHRIRDMDTGYQAMYLFPWSQFRGLYRELRVSYEHLHQGALI